jgi:hypothetical protein
MLAAIVADARERFGDELRARRLRADRGGDGGGGTVDW